VDVSASELSGRQAYGLLVDSIVPRPVAWVTTLGPAGETNLAPFSFFSGVTARPPIVSISVASRPERSPGEQRAFVPKDSARNIQERGEFVVHLAPASWVERVQRSAEDHPPGTSVPELLGLRTAAGSWVGVPRLVDAPISMECRLERVVTVGRPETYLVLGEVLGWHVKDELLDEEGRAWALRWDPIARLGVDGYVPPRESS